MWLCSHPGWGCGYGITAGVSPRGPTLPTAWGWVPEGGVQKEAQESEGVESSSGFIYVISFESKQSFTCSERRNIKIVFFKKPLQWQIKLTRFFHSRKKGCLTGQQWVTDNSGGTELVTANRHSFIQLPSPEKIQGTRPSAEVVATR